MEAILKQIKTELKTIRKENSFKLKRVNNHYQDRLDYYDYYSINRKKHYLMMSFIFQKKENSLSFIYNYVCTLKNCDINTTNSFQDALEKTIPGVNKADRQKLIGIYDFEVIDDIIQNKVSIEEQTKVVLDVFKNSYKSIIQSVKLKNEISE